MADEILVLRGQGNVDVQIGGPGNPWIYLSACAWLGGPTVPKGSTEIRWCQDPLSAEGFKISSKIRTAPDQVSMDLMTKLGKVDYLDSLDCPFTVRARYAMCGGERFDPSNWDPIMLSYTETTIEEHSYEDLVAIDPSNQDEIIVTAPLQAFYEYRTKKIKPGGRIGEGTDDLGDAPINDLEICGVRSCGGYCKTRSDGCSAIYGVTDADTSPYANPNLIKGVKDQTTKDITWTVTPILGFNGNIEGIECAGNTLLVSGNADSAVAYNTNDGDQDSWNLVSLPNAPTANPNALFARTGREIWVGAENGYIYKSINGGLNYTAVLKGQLTAENINAVFAYDKDLVYAAGDNGILLKSTDGGAEWEDITDTSVTSANLIVVKVPPNRPREVYVGTNNGKIIRSTAEGASLAAITFEGDGVGTVDDIEFTGPYSGEVMFILHNDAGPRGRILRDHSGGYGGADVDIVTNYTDIVNAGIELNTMAVCGPNEVWAGGENYSGYPMLIRAS